MRLILCSIAIFCFLYSCSAQQGFGNNWMIGQGTWNGVSGSQISFKNDTVTVEPIQMEMELEGTSAVMSDSSGNLLFYSNGCYIANKHHEMMLNSDSIGLGKLETSFCNTGGNPLTQGIVALPAPLSNNLYYMFYMDIEDPYGFPSSLYFPLTPLHLYYCLIDMEADGGNGVVIEKNQLVVSDTLSRGMIQAIRHSNGNDWWIVMPKSHSNCFHTIKLSSSGVDTTFFQCAGYEWDDHDATGQAVFSPNRKLYVRANYYNGLNIYDFNNSSGMMSNPIHISFGVDTFYYSGAAFSPNSRFLYIPVWDKVYQFDMQADDIEASRMLIAELATPSNISIKTRFNHALLAPNGKIYIGGASSFIYLHTIHNPNCPGMQCNLEQYAVETYTNNSYGLPNMPNFINWNESDVCDDIVNTEDNNIETDFLIYPNPFKDELTLEGKSPCAIIIYDSFGRIAFQTKIETFPVLIDLQDDADGIYYYKMHIRDGFVSCGKLIKKR